MDTYLSQDSVIPRAMGSPTGTFQAVSQVRATQLGDSVVSATIAADGVNPVGIGVVAFGILLSPGYHPAQARQSALEAAISVAYPQR